MVERQDEGESEQPSPLRSGTTHTVTASRQHIWLDTILNHLSVQATYDKLQAEVPKYKMITPSVLSDRLRVGFCLESFVAIEHPFNKA